MSYKKIIIALLSAFLCVFAVSGIFNADAPTLAAPIVQPVSAAPYPPAEIPVALSISAIHQNISVIPVGVISTGILDTPHNFTQAGWYAAGTLPGQTGSAVIDAHVDNGGSIPGVFKHLRDLKPGDDVYVITDKGSHIHFRVIGSAQYAYAQVPKDALFNQNDQAYLKLVTCAGQWIPSEKTYSDRLIVTTVLVNP